MFTHTITRFQRAVTCQLNLKEKGDKRVDKHNSCRITLRSDQLPILPGIWISSPVMLWDVSKGCTWYLSKGWTLNGKVTDEKGDMLVK